jgi:hypothetical protein
MMESTLTQVQNEKQAEARKAFVAACWKDMPTGELLTLAESAGMTAEQADSLIREIEQAKADKAIAESLPERRKIAATAKATFEKVKAEKQPIIDEAEEAIEDAAFASEKATRTVYEGEAAVRRLLATHTEGAIPSDMLPSEIHSALRREAEESKRCELHDAWNRATQRVDAFRAEIEATEGAAKKMKVEGLAVIWSGEKALTLDSIGGRLKRLREGLAAAEKDLKTAKDAARAAGCDLP